MVILYHNFVGLYLSYRNMSIRGYKMIFLTLCFITYGCDKYMHNNQATPEWLDLLVALIGIGSVIGAVVCFMMGVSKIFP